ncbi:MAG TPA: indole-3-glycerol phosphate synthase TrpC [Candidatus Limnocylindria bacterium]|nr:indole-3-glycerol phosphate synthase TrpC [Candidatus Limnocylindria bacterium]
MNHLDRLVGDARRELEARRAGRPEAELEQAAHDARSQRLTEGDFLAAVRAPGLSLIAEHKRRSPSAGRIREDLSLEEVVKAYERGGAAALSILTDAPNFGGSLDDLAAARGLTHLPLLRKDFIIERYQLLEAAAAGADAVLLIVAALSPDELERLQGQARELGLTALVEVHDARELEVALAAGSQVIGINNRDLTTLEVDVRTTFRLLELMDGQAAVVAESGLRDRAQLDELAAAGIDGVLIGESLMRAGDIEAATRALLER